MQVLFVYFSNPTPKKKQKAKKNKKTKTKTKTGKQIKETVVFVY